MTAGPQVHVLCGGVSGPGGGNDVVRLSASGTDPSLTVELDGLTRKLLADIAPRWHDLLLIAAYVLAVDQGIRRGRIDDVDLGQGWHRRLHFTIPVRDLEF